MSEANRWDGVTEKAAFVETLIGELLGVIESRLPKELPDEQRHEQRHYVVNALMWTAAQVIYEAGPGCMKYAMTALAHCLSDAIKQGTAIDSTMLKTASTRCLKVDGNGETVDRLELGAPVVTDKMQIN